MYKRQTPAIPIPLIIYNKKRSHELLIIPKFKITKGNKNIVSIITVLITIPLLAFLLILFVLKYAFTFFLKDFKNLSPFALENFGCLILSYFKLKKY